MIKLTLTEKGGEPKVLSFDKDEITIGRVSGNDIVLAKGNVSKRHSKLAVRGAQIEVSDLKSTNGTYVNGRKISGPTLLGPSDRIYVGDFLIGIEGAEDTTAHGGSSEELETGGIAGSAHPVPPPPPPRAAPGSPIGIPADDEDEDDGGELSAGEMQDEDDFGLAARPPRATRGPIPPPPPPPPPRRPATPLASHALDEALAAQGLDGEPPAPRDEVMGAPSEDTGAVGLFAHSRRTDEDLEGAGPRRLATANRPGIAAAPAAAAPAPAFGERAGTGPTAAPDLAGAAPLFEALLADASVTQIVLTGPDAVLVDRGAGLAPHPEGLGDPNAVADAVWRYANTAYPPPPPDNPVVDVRLPDGTRLSAIFPPASPAGVVASIRRPVLTEHALGDLVPGGNRDVQTLLEALLATRRNVLVTGDAAALPLALGALAGAIAKDRRVVAIGASARAWAGWTDLMPTADPAGLVRVAAALRPDHLVVGEVTGHEIAELVLVAARGGEGLLIAVPGRSAGELLARLVALAAPALGGAASAASLAASAFDIVLQVVTTSDAGARIVEVSEPRALGSELVADAALALYSDGSNRDPAGGRLQGRGVSARLGAAMAAAGSPVPASILNK